MVDKQKAKALFAKAQKLSLDTKPPNVPYRAIELAEAALAEDPDFVEAAALLANDLRRAKNYDKSIEVYKYALERIDIDSSNYKQRRNLLRDIGRVLVLSGKYDEATGYLENSLEIEQTSASEYLAEAYSKLGRHQDIINLYSHVEQLSENGRMVDEPAFHLGRAYKALGNKEKAKSIFEAGLRFNGANDDIKAELKNLKGGGVTTSEKGEWKEAMGPHEFEACVGLDVEYGGNKVRAKSDVNALGCVNCHQANPLEACKNCGNQAYSFGIGQDNLIGLFCTKCKQGFTSWKCVCDTVNPVSSRTLLKKDTGGCFIATAAYGAVNSPEVLYLLAFRDDVLQKSSSGRVFIRFYYWISPYLADFISEFRIFRFITRLVVIQPIIFAIRIIRKLCP